jgi:hypothetical protein
MRHHIYKLYTMFAVDLHDLQYLGKAGSTMKRIGHHKLLNCRYGEYIR